jgi:hypothetical protein
MAIHWVYKPKTRSCFDICFSERIELVKTRYFKVGWWCGQDTSWGVAFASFDYTGNWYLSISLYRMEMYLGNY